MHMCEQWRLHCTTQWGVVDAMQWACVLCGCHTQMTEWVEQWICIKFHMKLEHSSAETVLMTGSFTMTTHLLMHHVSCSFLMKHQMTQVTQPSYSPVLVPHDVWLFPKTKITFERGETINDIQENMGQLMVTGRTVWGPKVPTLKVTEESLYYVQCFLYLVSSSINVSIFHITWLDSFWADLVYVLRGSAVRVC